MGGDVRAVFDRLARGIKAVGDSVKAESGKDFMLDPKYGYVHSCPTNLELVYTWICLATPRRDWIY